MKPDENVIDASKKAETAYDLVADILADSIGLYPTRKADASDSDASAAKTAAKTRLTPFVTITVFSHARYRMAIADGASLKMVSFI